jgi:hypothetical protein
VSSLLRQKTTTLRDSFTLSDSLAKKMAPLPIPSVPFFFFFFLSISWNSHQKDELWIECAMIA